LPQTLTTLVAGALAARIPCGKLRFMPSKVLIVERLETRTLLDATLLIGTWNVDIADTVGANRNAAAFQEVLRAIFRQRSSFVVVLLGRGAIMKPKAVILLLIVLVAGSMVASYVARLIIAYNSRIPLAEKFLLDEWAEVARNYAEMEDLPSRA